VLFPRQADSESDRFVARVPLCVVQMFGLVGVRFAPRANCRTSRLARPARAHKDYVSHNPYPAINHPFFLI
jgi:protein-S-isoprenylcysteine O-methyltransferase Ste14